MLSGFARLEPFIYTILRFAAGFLFVFHGFQKLFGMFGGREVEWMSRLGAASVIEIGAGTLIALGLFTVPAAILAAGEMAFAYYLAHFPNGRWPIENGGEPAVLYLAIFLFVAARGPGPVSVDRLLGH
jgi:putative oxidoreductase